MDLGSICEARNSIGFVCQLCNCGKHCNRFARSGELYEEHFAGVIVDCHPQLSGISPHSNHGKKTALQDILDPEDSTWKVSATLHSHGTTAVAISSRNLDFEDNPLGSEGDNPDANAYSQAARSYKAELSILKPHQANQSSRPPTSGSKNQAALMVFAKPIEPLRLRACGSGLRESYPKCPSGTDCVCRNP
ncbi:hypothetical protein HBI18_225070 [Parastagonospora nodorum]|nr:hypothetical protein HBI18_225070 [Parastagonospora nodorum]